MSVILNWFTNIKKKPYKKKWRNYIELMKWRTLYAINVTDDILIRLQQTNEYTIKMLLTS